MGKTIYMFPGQGSQAVGMAKDVYEKYPLVRELFADASESCEMDIAKLCFESTEDELKKTENAQPALFVCSYAIASVLRQKGKMPDLVAGHSLGEYTAVTVAGMLTFRSACKLIKIRGSLMAKAGKKNPGTMAAIIGLPPEQVEEVCREASAVGTVAPANYNSPQQLVVSGETVAVRKAMELAKLKGAKRAIELQVSAAFHSLLMMDIAAEFQEALKQTRFSDVKIPVISNVIAQEVTSGEQMRDLLLRQLVSPVRWTSGVEKAIEIGVDTAVEIGHGKVLTGLLRRINRDVKTYSIEDTKSISGFVGEL